MRAEKIGAATFAQATARNNQGQTRAYRNSLSASTKFLNLAANFLFSLQTETLSTQQSERGWQAFESALRRYIDLKYCGVQL